MGKTQIEWAEHVWNPVVGCSVISPGCTNCYAMKQAARLLDKPGTPYEGTTKRVNGHAVWTGDVWMNSETAVYAPLKRKKPTRWFVNSMGDLFHENVPFPWIDQVFAIMAMAPQHTFLVLTKRADRMAAYFAGRATGDPWAEAADSIADLIGQHDHPAVLEPSDIPLPNVWLGTSAEDEERYRQRWHHVAATPAAVRFLSYEPGLGPIGDLDLGRVGAPNWVIVGGESGPGARTFNAEWARRIRDQCDAAGVALFIKQLGAACVDEMYGISGAALRVDPDVAHLITRLKDRKGGDMSEWPTDLRIREFPDA